MSFYENIYTKYEDIFPAGKKQINFLNKTFQDYNASTILDVACGTGAYSRAFAKNGYKVIGVDFEEKMIEVAKRKAALENIKDSLNFNQGDMRKIPNYPNPFDAIVCMGNSLPHLTLNEDIDFFLIGCKKNLRRKQGLLIIQTVNYNRILKYNVKELPTIVNKEKDLTFIRKYSTRKDGLINFDTVLKVKEGSEVESRVVLRPLVKKDLEDFLRRNHFKNVKFFGSFDGDPWNENTMATIIVSET